MKVKVRFFTRLREITDKREEEIQVEDRTTVEELLKALEEKYGSEFGNYLRNERGRFRKTLHYLINGKNVRSMGGLASKLNEGDILAIIPPVGGG